MRLTATGEAVTLDAEFVRYCEVMGRVHKEFVSRYFGRARKPGVRRHALRMIEPQVRAIAPFGLPS